MRFVLLFDTSFLVWYLLHFHPGNVPHFPFYLPQSLRLFLLQKFKSCFFDSSNVTFLGIFREKRNRNVLKPDKSPQYYLLPASYWATKWRSTCLVLSLHTWMFFISFARMRTHDGRFVTWHPCSLWQLFSFFTMPIEDFLGRLTSPSQAVAGKWHLLMSSKNTIWDTFQGSSQNVHWPTHWRF